MISTNRFKKGDLPMKKNRFAALLLSALAILPGFALAAEEHEPITFTAPFRDASNFIEVVHEHYPEINIEVVPYSGQNATSYLKAALATGNEADIICMSVYTPGADDMSDKLIDLSGNAFMDNYVESRLREVADDGAIYLVPTFYNCAGITYNKAILEKEGWAVPQSLAEMAELKEKAEAKGYQLCIDEMLFPGYGFQYMCNIADTGYLSTLGGRRWQQAFLNGETTLADSPEMLACFETIAKWRDLGLLNSRGDKRRLPDVVAEMAEGNTLFMLGSSNDFSTFGEDVASQFAIMPYLSEDGSQNVFILNVNGYYGLSKRLEQPGNEQKLEDALHVMEVLSTPEGMNALYASVQNVAMMSLKDAPLRESNYYSDPAVLEMVNSGYTAPFIYTGWENVVVEYGNKMFEFIDGDCEIEDVIAFIDENQYRLANADKEIFTTVTERIDTEDCARAVGVMLGEAVDADAALISVNAYYGVLNNPDLNRRGVSGALFPTAVTDQEITAILPTGWGENIETVTLTGARIRELAQTGFEVEQYGVAYPYVLETKGGMALEDDQTYTVVICGVTDAVAEEGNLTDTGVLGLDAAKAYFSRFETFSAKDIEW